LLTRGTSSHSRA